MAGVRRRIPLLRCVGAAVCALAWLGCFVPVVSATTPTADHTIAALVNDEVVSSRDVENRVALFLVTGNLRDQPEIRGRLAAEVLNMLIDDRLKRQEARRLGIVVSREEIDNALLQIASQVNLPPEQLPAYLAQRGATFATLREQVETEIAWAKVVSRQGGDSVSVSEEEIDEELDRRRAAAGKPEYRVGEIFFAVDDPKDEQRARELSARLIEEIRAGASFGGLARIFSSGPSAAVGGDLGWVTPGQLEPELERVLASMEPGQLAGPVRSPGGYHLLALFGKRIAAMPPGNVVLTMLQVTAGGGANPTGFELDQRASVLRELVAAGGDCAEIEGRSHNQGGLTTQMITNIEARRLAPELQEVVLRLKPGEATPPFRTQEGIGVLMVCERQDAGVDAETRQNVRRFLREERLAVASRRLLRDLRRASLVDILK